MEKIFPVVLFVLLFISCKKDHLVPADEIPFWLKERIALDEKTAISDRKSGLENAAWIRVKYNDAYYFEYHNSFSSYSEPKIYDINGLIINLYPVYKNYTTMKCCQRYVWKGNSYFK